MIMETLASHTCCALQICQQPACSKIDIYGLLLLLRCQVKRNPLSPSKMGGIRWIKHVVTGMAVSGTSIHSFVWLGNKLMVSWLTKPPSVNLSWLNTVCFSSLLSSLVACSLISHYYVSKKAQTECSIVTLPVNKEDDFVPNLLFLQSFFEESHFLASSWSSHVVASLPFLTSTKDLKTYA